MLYIRQTLTHVASCADLGDSHVIDETDDLSALAAGRAAGGGPTLMLGQSLGAQLGLAPRFDFIGWTDLLNHTSCIRPFPESVSTQTPEQIFSFIKLFFFAQHFFVEAGKRKRKKKSLRSRRQSRDWRGGGGGFVPVFMHFSNQPFFFRFDDVWGPFPPDWHISSRAGVPGRPNPSNPYNTYVLINHTTKRLLRYIYIYIYICMYVHIRTYISVHTHTYITN